MFKFLLMPWTRHRLAKEAEDARLRAMAAETKAKETERLRLQSAHRADHQRKHVESVLTAQNAVRQRESLWRQPDDPGYQFATSNAPAVTGKGGSYDGGGASGNWDSPSSSCGSSSSSDSSSSSSSDGSSSCSSGDF